jgi:hypothetical protein
MFRSFLNWLFADAPRPVQRVLYVGAIEEGENDMTATIVEKKNGKFGLFIPKTGEEVGTYSRARDARRGAARRGLELA